MISYRVDYAIEMNYDPFTGCADCICNTIYKDSREEIDEVIEYLQNKYVEKLLRLTLTTTTTEDIV